MQSVCKKTADFIRRSLPDELGRLLPLLVLAVGLGATLFMWRMLDGSFNRKAELIFDDKANDVSSGIVRRLHDHEKLLLGGVGLFSANGEVTREQWRRYVSSLQLGQNHPGILGIGYAAWLTPEKKDAHIRKIRAEGFPEYDIRPPGKRPVYTSIVYLEPFDRRNRRAFGYDMYSEAHRRVAMEKARNEGITTLAGGIVLVQETDSDKQFGLLMYLPVYREGAPTESREERREALKGFVYTPLRIIDFVTGTLGVLPTDIAFEIFDGETARPENLLFSSHSGAKGSLPAAYHPKFTQSKRVVLYGRTWTFTFKSLPPFDRSVHQSGSRAALLCGLLISGLLALVTFSLRSTRDKAQTLARLMTRDLRESEAKLILANREWRNTFDTIPDLIAIIDTGYRVVRANRAMTAAMKVDGDEIPGLICYRHFHGADAPPADCPHRQLLADGREHRAANYEERLGGWFQITATPILDEAGKLTGSVHVAHEVTESREREQLLLVSEVKYRQLHESLMDAFVKTDLKGKIIESNTLFREMLGYSYEELTSLAYAELTPPSWHAMEAQLVETQILGRGYTDVYQKEYVTKSGNVVPVELRGFLLRDLNGEPEAMWAIIRDITARKQLEAEIRDAREYAENIVETVREPLVVLDSHLKILTANQSFYATFQVTPEETIGNFIYDLGNRQWDIPALRLLFEKILPNDTVFNGYEVEHEFPGIGHKTILLNAREIFRKDIGSHIILLAMEDITRDKANQEMLLNKDQALMLSEKMASVGQLAAGVAHEINTPMGYISCNLGILSEYLDNIVRFDRVRRDIDDAELLPLTREIIANSRESLAIENILCDSIDLINESLEGAERVTKIVRDLKSFSRVDAQEYETVTLSSCLESALTVSFNVLKKVAVVRKEYESGQAVLCHPGQLNQVFLNLLVNAGQAMVEKGEIVLRSRHDDYFVYASVSDSGSGIPKEILSRIFDPFYTTKDVGKGTGLGLSISHEIIKKHSGELLVESAVGVGTTFTVKLPRTSKDAA